MTQPDVFCKTTGEIALILRGSLLEFPEFAVHLAYCPHCYAHAFRNAKHFDRMAQLDVLVRWRTDHPTLHEIQEWEDAAVRDHVSGCTFCSYAQANLRAAMSGRAQGT